MTSTDFAHVGRHHDAVRRATWPLRSLWLDVNFIDQQNVPGDGPVLLAPNHLLFLDSPILMFGLGRRASFLGKSEYLRGRVTRWLFPAAGMIPVDRSGKSVVSSMKCAEQRLAAGEIVGIFPEGTRRRDGLLHDGHSGVAHLALRTGAPIIPVGITGSDAAQPAGARLPRRGAPISVRFGSPIDLGPWAGQRLNAVIKAEVTEEVMKSIAALSGQTFATSDRLHGPARASASRRVREPTGERRPS